MSQKIAEAARIVGMLGAAKNEVSAQIKSARDEHEKAGWDAVWINLVNAHEMALSRLTILKNNPSDQEHSEE